MVHKFLTTKGLCFFNSTLEVSFQRSIFQGETVRLHTYVLQNTICVFSLLKNFSLFLFFLSVSFFITLVSKKKMPSVETVTMDIFFLKSILFCHTWAHVAEVVLTQTSALIYVWYYNTYVRIYYLAYRIIFGSFPYVSLSVYTFWERSRFVLIIVNFILIFSNYCKIYWYNN